MKVYTHRGEYDVQQIYRPDVVATIEAHAISQRKKFLSPPEYIAPPAPPRPVAPILFHLHPATNDANLRKRANNKVISEALSIRLLSLNGPMQKYYQRQYRCADELTRKGNKLTSQYCGCKTCQVCNKLRSGKLMNKYDELSQSLHDPMFVTLTCRNILRADYDTDSGFVDALRSQLDQFNKIFRSMQDYFRKRDIPLKGIRATEIIPSKRGDGAHPHIHWQIDGDIDIDEVIFIWKKHKFSRTHLAFLLKQYRRESNGITAGAIKGELIIQLWQKKIGDKADRQGQNARPCDKYTRKELFKYATKIFVYDEKKGRRVDIELIDMIVQASQNKRCIGVTGFLTREPRFDFDLYFQNRKFLRDQKAKEVSALILQWHKENNLFAGTCPYTPVPELDMESMRTNYESKYLDQVRDYMLYRSLDSNINDDLQSQDSELSDELSVDMETGELLQAPPVEQETFTWSGDNWYSSSVWIGFEQYETEPRKVVRFKIPNKTRKLCALFGSS